MAVGETAGPGRRVISAGGGRRRPEVEDAAITSTAAVTDGTDDAASSKPLLGEADPELERLLAEEEEIEPARVSITRRRTSAGVRTNHVMPRRSATARQNADG